MVERRSLNRYLAYVAGCSAALVIATFIIGGTGLGIGALAGGLLATLNLGLMQWAGHRLLTAGNAGKMFWSIILSLKMGGLLVLAWGLLATGWVEPFGFMIGLSGLVLGILVGAFHAAASGEMSSLPAASAEN